MHKKRNGVIPFFGKIIALTVLAFSVKNVTVKSVKIRQLLKFFYESLFLFTTDKSWLREIFFPISLLCQRCQFWLALLKKVTAKSVTITQLFFT